MSIFIGMENQPHVRVPNECFFDQPPRPGEAGYDSEYTPIELRRYMRQQRVLEKAIAANEKFNLENQIKLCAIHSGSLWNAQHDCAHLIDEYTKRLRCSPEYGKNINSVVNVDILSREWDGYQSPVYSPTEKK